jgi:UDP-glucose 4-epimerase
MATAISPKTILITGAGGYVGRLVVAELAERMTRGEVAGVVATQRRETPVNERLPGVHYGVFDVRDAGLADLLRSHAVTTVIHLAAVVTPGTKSDREVEYSIDVQGTRNVLDACLAANVEHVIVSSSGAAYGYHADNANPLKESDPIRGNYAFAYAWHKRLVEEMLAEYRAKHPALRQTIFRIGVVLGDTAKNQLTDFLEKPRLIGIRGSESPFGMIWDQDVVGILVAAALHGKEGIYNVAGDGVLSIHEVAARLGKPVVMLPAGLVRFGLRVLRTLGLTQYGPEQMDYLRYRPVLDNRALKETFGYVPAKSSSEVFDYWLATRRRN